jgi:hypothetical protein
MGIGSEAFSHIVGSARNWMMVIPVSAQVADGRPVLESSCCTMWRDIDPPPNDVERSLAVDRLLKEKPKHDPVIDGICRLLQSLFNVSAASTSLCEILLLLMYSMPDSCTSV